MSTKSAVRLLELFQGRSSEFAVGRAEEDDRGRLKIAYRPSGHPLTVEDLEAHMDGSGPVVGVYLLREDSHCKFASFDIDQQDLLAAEKLRGIAMDLGFPESAMMLVDSGNKGYHLHLFFAEWTPGNQVRQLMLRILAGAAMHERRGPSDADGVEVFPKQDGLTPPGEGGHITYGNLIKLPLVVHPASGRLAGIINARRVIPAAREAVEAVVGPQGAPGVTEAPAVPVSAPLAISPVPEGPGTAVVTEGGRNATLTSWAGKLRRDGAAGPAIEQVLLELNQKLCSPPLPEREVRAIARSVSRYPAGEGDMSLKPPEPPANPGQQIGIIANLIDIMPTTWLWKHHLPVGMLGMLDGDPGDGKSTMVADLAAHITTGTAWHDGSPCPRKAVIMIGAEDSLSHTVRPRLMAAGADLNEILLIGLIEDGKGGRRMPSLPGDIPLLEYTISQMSVGLIVFDPIMPYLAASLSANSDKDVRQALTPLAEMLDRTQCTGLMLRHYAKNDKVSSAIYRGLGSIGFVGVSRFAMAVKREKEDEERFVLMMSKTNVGPKIKGRNYTIERVVLPSVHGEVETSKIVWGDESDLRPGDMLTAFGAERKQKDVAKVALVELLSDGPMRSDDCIAELAERGVSKDMAWKTKKAIGVKSTKVGLDHWEWSLPSRTRVPFHSQGTLAEILEEAA